MDSSEATAPRKVYLAGQSSNAQNIAKIAEEMETLGYEINWPWWEYVLDGTEKTPHEVAEADCAAVKNAAVVVAVVDEACGHGRGLWFELGLAYALGKPTFVLIIGEDTTNVWPHIFATVCTDYLIARHDPADQPPNIAEVARLADHLLKIPRYGVLPQHRRYGP